MPTPTTTGRGENQGIIIVPIGGNMRYYKKLDDYFGKHLFISKVNKVAYCWGGEPKTGVDEEDILFVTIGNRDYEVPVTAVRPVMIDSVLPGETTADNHPEEEAETG